MYVTHGIFSKGLDVLGGYVDYVFCPNIVGGYINQQDIQKFNSK
ncbi:hypothetical protein [Vibrio phage JSF2]|nr:hypothetical protein [Vibrio phage JSF2]